MRCDSSPSTAKTIWATARFGVLVCLVAGMAIATFVAGPDRGALTDLIQRGPVAAPVIAVGGSAVLVTALVPRTLLALVGGVLFGTLGGAGYVLVGLAIGSAIAFGIGRLLGRDFVAGRLRGRLAMIEQAVARRATLSIIVARLIPLVPFGASNYAFGTTSTSLRSFVVGTVVGAAPATLAYAALGSATIDGDPRHMTLAGTAVGLIAVVGWVGSYLVWRRRPRRAAPADAAESTQTVSAGVPA